MDEVKDGIIETETLELGIIMGQRRAFGMMAGRSSAAHAECIRRIHDEKRYLKVALTWEEYCERFLKISSRTANRMIALLRKHGPVYFETAALTGIAPAEYARIEHAIRADGIHVGGDVIALIPENAARAVEAVARLQAEAAAADGAAVAEPAHEQIARLEKLAARVCDGFRKSAKTANCVERPSLARSIKTVRQMFDRLEMEIT